MVWCGSMRDHTEQPKSDEHREEDTIKEQSNWKEDINRRSVLRKLGAISVTGGILTFGSGQAAATKGPKRFTPTTQNLAGLEEIEVKLYSKERVEYRVSGVGKDADIPNYQIGLQNVENEKGEYTPDKAKVVIQSPPSTAPSTKSRGSPKSITKSGSANESTTSQDPQAGAFCTVTDPLGCKLCRTRHTLDFTCGGSTSNWSNWWYSAYAWSPTCAGTHWKYDWNQLEYVQNDPASSQVQAQYYNTDFLTSAKTTVWMEIDLTGYADCSWDWAAHWTANGEGASLLSANMGQYSR